MRGLLIKDIHLMIRQKNTLLLVVLILFLLSRNGLEFTLGYFILCCFILGDSTVGIDNKDRGMAYLMTFPVSRSTYVLEKYMLTLLPGVFGTAVAMGIRFAAARIQGIPADTMEVAVSCIGIFLACSLLVAVFLPMELLGKEKSQIIINIGAAVFGVCLVMLMKNEAAVERIRTYTVSAVEGIHGTGLSLGVIGIWLVVMASSMLCSVLIMKKKQF